MTRTRWWALSLAIPMILVALRMGWTHSLTYAFYYWNLFLATIPLMAVRRLDPEASLWSYRNLVGLGMWFFFLPNAPYLITDMVHFQEGPKAPVYLDEAIVYACAFNGVLLGYASVRRVEDWMLKRYRERPVRFAILVVFLACGFGIYLGRYLRLNSWYIVTQPLRVGRVVGVRVLCPLEYKQTWAVTLLFGALLWLGYLAFRSQVPRRNTA
ncbi:DUF1361 domain-containing protein [Dinghuibacter silviterrae]|uniref:Putative membrane protein n=1 Tax=Dinghuibacter silviterrae TaxID=1539049 RepID=A0A4R8DQN9_9BACT|nr:DUF1361 domain-containing protein [Dinghuibacter silviterrae]TDW99440.1 putative membrane protein [Dinghuibacter silviterrae]